MVVMAVAETDRYYVNSAAKLLFPSKWIYIPALGKEPGIECQDENFVQSGSFGVRKLPMVDAGESSWVCPATGCHAVIPSLPAGKSW